MRELKELGIGIIFEKENIDTMDSKGEVLLTILSSLAQDESRSISENCTWGIRRRFEQGKHKMSTKRFLGYDYDEDGNLVINRQQAKVVVRLYEEFLSGKTVDYIARIFTAEKIKSWDGKCNWVPSTLDSMLRNEKYMGDTILQKSYTVDFLSKKRVMNDGTIQKFHIEEDHEAIIPPDMWQAVQMEIERRDTYVKAHKNNAYGQRSEVNLFFGKIVCGDCDSAYSRTKYKAKDGHEIRKWRCGSCNKSNGHKVCYNRYVEEDAFIKLFIMSFNEIVDTIETYKELWDKNEAGDNPLLRYQTKLIREAASKGRIEEFDPALMMAIVDHFTVHEDGRLQIRYHDGTEFEVATE